VALIKQRLRAVQTDCKGDEAKIMEKAAARPKAQRHPKALRSFAPLGQPGRLSLREQCGG